MIEVEGAFVCSIEWMHSKKPKWNVIFWKKRTKFSNTRLALIITFSLEFCFVSPMKLEPIQKAESRKTDTIKASFCMDFVWLRVSELFLPSVSYNLIFFCSFSWLWQTKFRLSLSLSSARIAKQGWAAHKKRWSARIKLLHLALEILDSSIDLIAFSALSFGAYEAE